MSENKTENKSDTKSEMVRVRVRKGRSYCEDEFARTRIHLGGEELMIPRSRLNHTVELLDEPPQTTAQTKAPEPANDPDKNKPQHRMIESPRGGGRK